jgi:hypothetical protein
MNIFADLIPLALVPMKVFVLPNKQRLPTRVRLMHPKISFG